MQLFEFRKKIIPYIKKNKIFLFLLLLTIPSFLLMLRPGMYSTQDFHIFRQVQFDKCIKSLEIPCRWAPDAGLGYGEPLFNFYGQFVYLIGELYFLISGSYINSIKFLFILSLSLSALTMYILSKKIWKNELSGVLSALVYVYAPYRSVDVWVRGALPEAFAFIFFPLIILAVEFRSVKWLSLFLFLLIITHNLSFLMFLPFLIVWIAYRKFFRGFWGFIISGLLSAFYLLPVIFESRFVNLHSTIEGYFDFHNHYATLNQLFLNNFWGYGASNWGPVDDISLSIGYLQWILPLITGILLLLSKKIFRYKEFLILTLTAGALLFLTHNKSTFIWELVRPMAYIQFPWRFLGIIVFCLALAAGLLINFLPRFQKIAAASIIVILLVINIPYFKPDIWYPVKDDYYLTGKEWDRQRTASIGDFWPKYRHPIPSAPSDGKYINYFPGWLSQSTPSAGLIPAEGAVFKDTPVRRIGNLITLLAMLSFVFSGFIIKKWKKST
jgi:hypothetical protein